jgi:hypothetical protein
MAGSVGVAQSPPQANLYEQPVRPFSHMAIALEAGTLGAGVQVATPLTRTLNLRGTADGINFGYGLTIDAAQYEGEAHLRSGRLSVDWHPRGGGFHISPGLLFLHSGFAASVYVPGGQSFDLGNTPYVSGPGDPVHGGATLTMQHKVMPALTIGWGNVFGERRRHWSIPVELGAAYTGHSTVSLNLAGTACWYIEGYYGCLSTSDPEIQQNVVQEERDLNETMKRYQVYPILMTGFAYRF